jgi:ribonuclease HI
MNGKLGSVSHVGIGIYIPSKNIKVSKRLKGISNNEAEYMALIEAMDICKQHEWHDVKFYLDSTIVVNGATKPWKVTKNQRMNEFKSQIVDQLINFTSISFHWIPREENEEADLLSKQSLYSINNIYE